MINNKELAFVFPGQGSQSVGMMRELLPQFPEIKETFIEASDILKEDLWSLAETGPKEKLDETIYTQPVLLTASIAIWRLIQNQASVRPAYLAGHSLGEYTALVLAESISFRDAVQLVSLRGKYMQESVKKGEGAMAAIVGLDDASVEALCDEARLPNEVLSPANYNSLGQVVIAGHHASVVHAISLAKTAGAKLATMIPVSVPSHCALMKGAAEQLRQRLETVMIQTPVLPIINNADVQIYRTQDDIKQGLVKQLYSPVRWVETIQFLIQSGITTIAECGPGKILTGLNKRIDKSLNHINLNEINNLNEFLKILS